MQTGNRYALYWHAFFLAVTVSFTEVNTVMPALILEAGGEESLVGALTAVMVGLPLISQLIFAGFLHARHRKKPYLLLGINLRVVALAGAALGIARLGTSEGIIPVVFLSMAIFALSGAFAGVSYTDLVGKVVPHRERGGFFVNRQVATSLGLLVSAIATRVFLGATVFPEGYIVLFALASGFLLLATGGFWMIREPLPAETEANAESAGGRPSFRDAFREVPEILRTDRNMRNLIALVNMAAPGFTAIPLVTALAHRSYDLNQTIVGTFVLVQIFGMLGSNVIWTRLVGRGGFRLVLRAELLLLGVLFPLAFLAAGRLPVWGYGALYLVTGAVISAQRLGVEAVVVQIAPDAKRALYAGVFGAANLGTAVMPLVTGALVANLGFPLVFGAASLIALGGLVPLRSISCGEWYRNR
ncbi:MAG: MFS transporter [Alkalispirochaeta sp.]